MEHDIPCPPRATLQQALLGELPDEQAAIIESHLLSCAACMQACHSLEAGDMLVDALRAQPAIRTVHSELDDWVQEVKQRLHDPETHSSADGQEGTPALIDVRPLAGGIATAPSLALQPREAPDELGRLGSFRVLRQLGQGGMGVVFEAEDLQLKRRVALKVLQPKLGKSADIAARFLREARAAAAVRHDHVITIYQVGQDGETPFIAMELLEGETLEQRLRRNGKLGVSETLRIGRDTAAGLAAAHNRGLLHRDIKPSNIWLEAENDRVKILDFGLARAIEDDTRLTQDGMLVGTPSYMAPEQVKSRNVDERADLFSLGCVIYRACTGRLPFRGGSILAVLSALANETPQAPATIDEEIPVAFSDLILRLLSKDRSQRPVSAMELVASLEHLQRAGTIPPPVAQTRSQEGSVDQFVENLSATGLLSQAELAAIRSDLAARQTPPTAETLARELVRSGKLTKFQAHAIYQGKIKGLVCGDYVLLERIGAGSMGQVYKACHKSMNRIVAVKLLAHRVKTTLEQKTKAIKRFYHEVELAGRLVHPNIVTSYDAGESNGLHYLVMEYIDGQDLSTLLNPDKKLPLEQVLGIVLQIARGLEYAHAQGVVHCDIKPSNLLLDRQGTVKILDMGLARSENEVTGTLANGLTQSGEILGTVDYMAPEQARNSRDADARCDIYSLGCTLYRLAVGRAPFAGKSTVEKILAHREEPIPLLTERCEGVSSLLERTFQRMLAKTANERFQLMSEVIAELDSCHAELRGDALASQLVVAAPPDTTSEGFFSQAETNRVEFLQPSAATVPPEWSSTSGLSIAPNEVRHPRKRRSSAARPPMWAVGSLGVAVFFVLAAIVTFITRNQAGGTRQDLPKANSKATASIPVDATPATAQPPDTLVKGVDEPSSPPTAPPSVTTSTPTPETKVKPVIPGPVTGTPAVPAIESVVTKPAEPSVPSAAPQPPSDLAGRPESPTSRPSRAAGRVDLLRLLDLKRDVVSEPWILDDHALISPASTSASFPRLQFPYAPPPRYELRLVVAPLASNGHVAIGLALESSRTCFVFDHATRTSGLEDLAGKHFDENETTVTGLPSQTQNEPVEIVCRVDPTAVFITVNGQTAVNWKGDPRQFTVNSSRVGPDRTKLSLQCSGTGHHVTRCEVVPLGGQRVPIPSPPDVAEALAKLNQLFGGELPKNANAGLKRQRIANMLYEASKSSTNDALCYALLTEAIKLAADAENLGQLLDLVDDLGRMFQLDVAPQLQSALVRISSAARPPALRKELGLTLLELADKESTAERYDRAALLVSTAVSVLAKTKETDLQAESRTRELEQREWQKLWEAAVPARARLSTDPQTSQANELVGNYLAIARQDWNGALPYLAKSDHKGLREAAQLELKAASDPTRAIEIGTAWMEVAEKASVPAKSVFADHARRWLVRGTPGSMPATITKLQTRFKNLDADVRRRTGTAFVKRHPLRAVAFGGHWYQLVPEQLPWHQARQRCEELGGGLVCLESGTESQFVYALAAAQYGSTELFGFWIGATEEGHNQVFTWVNDAPFQFSEWKGGNPDPLKGGEAVVAERVAVGSAQFKWADVGPLLKYGFVCEWDR